MNTMFGEIDAIVFDTAKQHPVIVEVKSGYGYTFNKNVFGKSNQYLYPEGMPHMDYIMQVMWYLHLREKIEQVHGESPYALIYYIDRADSCNQTIRGGSCRTVMKVKP